MVQEIPIIYPVLLLVCLALSAFFSSSEAAFLTLQKVRIQHLVSLKRPGAQRLAQVAEHPERLLPTILLGNNLVNTGAAALGTFMAMALLGQQGVLVATVGVTALLLIFGEAVPKSLAVRHAERFCFILVYPFEWIERLLLPFSRTLGWISQQLTRPFPGSSEALLKEEEIRALISLGRDAGELKHQEAAMLERVFQFGDRQVREVMTPRNEIIWVEKGTPLKAFLATYAEHYHTRFPIYEELMDNVTGILSSKDVLREMASGRLKPEDSVTHLSRATFFAPETKPIGELFFEMRHQRTQMAMAVDEFGGVAGLVTLKQLIEVVAGSLMEEGVHEEQVLALDEVTYQVDGDLQIDEANERLGLNIPDGEYETLAGFLLKTLGHIPKEGESVHHDGMHIKVIQMKGVKIEKLLVTRAAPSARDARTQGIS